MQQPQTLAHLEAGQLGAEACVGVNIDARFAAHGGRRADRARQARLRVFVWGLGCGHVFCILPVMHVAPGTPVCACMSGKKSSPRLICR